MNADLVSQDLAFGSLVIGLAGGLALFLFGMDQMTGALKAVAGGGMRSLLGGLTRNRFLALFTGAFVTAVIQSSSVTTVLIVGFISAGLMSLSQSVGVIIGANIGTTVTAQIVAFKVTKYALLLIAIGFGGNFLGRSERSQQVGAMLMGLGLIFFGMGLMSEATSPLRSHAPFIEAMAGMERPALAIAAAALFTALVQSSSATTGIVIVLASQGFISLETGIALALGANIGTCVTAILATLGKPRPALQAAAVHVLFNVLGVLIWIPFIPDLAEFVREISPRSSGFSGAERLAAEVPRQVANAHTAFNVANAVLMIGFTQPIARFVRWLLPDRVLEAERAKPLYLDDVYLKTPALAVDRLRMEIGRLGELARSLVASTPDIRDRVRGSAELTDTAADLRSLYGAIVEYARRLLEERSGEEDTREIEEIVEVANHLHNIGDSIGINALAIATQAQERRVAATPATREMFRQLVAEIEQSVAQAVWAFSTQDRALARHVVGLKADIYQRARDLETHLGRRLLAGDANQLLKYRLESEVLELLKRIYYFAKRIAKKVAKDAAEPPVDREVAA